MVVSASNSCRKWEKSSLPSPLNLGALSEHGPGIAAVPVCAFDILMAVCEVAGRGRAVVGIISTGVDTEAAVRVEGVGCGAVG